MQDGLQRVSEGLYRLSGSISYDNAEHWLAQGEQAWAEQPEVELDLSGLEAGDSAGLAVLIEWCLAARRRGHLMRCQALPKGMAVIAGLGGVAELLQGDRP